MSLFKLFFLFLGCFAMTAYADNKNNFELSHCETYLLREADLKNFRKMDVEACSVKIVGQRPGLHGGQLIILEKDADIGSWFSHFSCVPGGTQGDPRSVGSSLGVDLAYFFGIRELPGGRITIPDAAEINGARIKLNQALLEFGFKPIPIHFYVQSIADFQPFEYLQKFTDFFQLPFASAGPLQIHDISYHLMAVMIPFELLEPAMSRYRWALDFYKYIKSHKDAEFMKSVDTSPLMNSLVSRIDVGLGNLQPFFNARLNSFSTFSIHGKIKFMLESAWGKFAFEGLSMREVGSRLISKIVWNLNSPDAVETELYRLYKEFMIEQNLPKTVLDRPDNLKAEDIYDKLIKRQTEMQKALRHLQKEKP